MRSGRIVALVAPVVLSGTTGCLASKGDIRLIQDELRVTRAQVATGDSAILRADAARQAQFAQLAATLDRVNDSLRVLTTRFALFQANATGEFDAMGKQIVQVQALLGQTTRNMQDARAQLEALREQGTSPASTASPVPPATGADTSQRAGGPGPATLFTSAIDAFKNGSYRTARSGFEDLVRTYPDYEQTPRAQVYIGDSYRSEGNTAAADSVYQLVAAKYPNNPVAASGLYKHGLILWDANKREEARIVFNRLIRDYPRSDEAELAKSKLNP
ncbi:MAG TPA: tetratricopeptide repeat protein [Gemmatimonadaceae bacterium]|jgi:tol-pal system protein YbgF|nr:tetratricopeptide repeat protein [Gemmatimonadaceae bacterium]